GEAPAALARGRGDLRSAAHVHSAPKRTRGLAVGLNSEGALARRDPDFASVVPSLALPRMAAGHPTIPAGQTKRYRFVPLLNPPAGLNQGGGGRAEAAAVRPMHAVARM